MFNAIQNYFSNEFVKTHVNERFPFDTLIQLAGVAYETHDFFLTDLCVLDSSKSRIVSKTLRHPKEQAWNMEHGTWIKKNKNISMWHISFTYSRIGQVFGPLSKVADYWQELEQCCLAHRFWAFQTCSKGHVWVCEPCKNWDFLGLQWLWTIPYNMAMYYKAVL